MSRATSSVIHRASRLMVARYRSLANRAALKRPLRSLPTTPVMGFKPKSPMHPFDMVRIAVNKDAKNDINGALKWLGKAIDSDVNFLMAYAIRAVILMKTKQYDMAFRDVIAVRMLNKGQDISRPSIAHSLAQVKLPHGMNTNI